MAKKHDVGRLWAGAAKPEAPTRFEAPVSVVSAGCRRR